MDPKAQLRCTHCFSFFCCSFSHAQFVSLAVCLFIALDASFDRSAPFAAYVQRPWWEIVAPVSADSGGSAGSASASGSAAAGQKRRRAADSDDDDDDDENESVAAHLRAVVAHSYALLRRALFEHRGKPVPPFFTPQWFASTVGSLRLNALAVEHPSPLRDYFEVVERRLEALVAQSDAATQDAKSMSDEDEDDDAQEGDAQADSSSSSSSDDDESEEDENDDDDGGSSRRLRLSATASAPSAAKQRSAILLQLMPLLSRAMRVRLEDHLARKAARAAARLAAQEAEEAGADAQQAAHARVRKVDRDSYPTQSYAWLLQYSRRHSQRLHFSTRLFPSLHASALYPTVAQANHSCTPNASVEHGQDAEAQMHATTGQDARRAQTQRAHTQRALRGWVVVWVRRAEY